ncbi:MAG: hypothetical protein ACREKH_04930, partial [Candidatus Rokuibacteriota bacterium]
GSPRPSARPVASASGVVRVVPTAGAGSRIAGPSKTEEGAMKPRIALLLVSLFGLPAVAPRAEATVLRIVVVQSDNPAAYAKELERGQAILKRLGSAAVIRVWRARFAGQEAGAVVATAEYADLATMARDEAKAAADPEWQTWLKGLDKVRKIVSDSLYDEIKP